MLNSQLVDDKLEVSLLGGFSLRVSGQDIEPDIIPGKKSALLLKILALQKNHELIKDQIIEFLWPQLDLKAGSAQLYKAIYNLRQIFSKIVTDLTAEEFIKIKGDSVRLYASGGVVTDIIKFKKAAYSGLKSDSIDELTQAVALYKGDLLPMDLYAQWTETPRFQLRQLYLDVLLQLSIRKRLKGDLDSAIEIIQMSLSKEDSFEDGHRELIRLYALKGQQSRAIQQFKICSDTLTNELGTLPSKETINLIEDIRQQKFPAFKEEVIDKLKENKGNQSFKIVGRQQETVTILKFLKHIKNLTGAMLVIEGAAGIGKTRLVQALTLYCKQEGLQSVIGKSYEIEGPIPYGPVIDIINSILAEDVSAANLIPEEIASYIPDFPKEVKLLSHADPFAAKSYFFVQLVLFFKKQSIKRPLVLIFEDMHEADNETLAFIHYFSRNIVKSPILLVLTYRNDKKSDKLLIQKYYTNLPIPVEVLNLQALTLEEHLDLLHQLPYKGNITSNLNKKIYKLSEGNPSFTIDLFSLYKNENFF